MGAQDKTQAADMAAGGRGLIERRPSLVGELRGWEAGAFTGKDRATGKDIVNRRIVLQLEIPGVHGQQAREPLELTIWEPREDASAAERMAYHSLHAKVEAGEGLQRGMLCEVQLISYARGEGKKALHLAKATRDGVLFHPVR